MIKIRTVIAAAAMTIFLAAPALASGWDNSTGVWQYLDKNEQPVVDEWEKSGDYYFYLGDDGNLVTNSLVEDDNDYYFVDINGARVCNSWRAVERTDNDSSIDAEYYWYYFGSDGKAYTIDSSNDLSTGKLKTINDQKYAFNTDGKMLYGWISASSKEQQDDDDEAWKTSEYYFNGWNDGHAQNGWIQLAVSDDDEDKNYWFFFENGKKKFGKQKINGKTYLLDENDGHMLDTWGATTGSTVSEIATNSDVKYLGADGSERKNKWVWAVPDEDYIEEDYDDDEYSWWYFNKSGSMAKREIKKINGKKYAFDEYGRMMTGFVHADGNVFENQIDNDKYSRDEVLDGALHTDGYDLYYFSENEYKDGSMKKGYYNVELKDDTYQFYFNKNSGKAETGFNDKIDKYLYNGLVLKPDADDVNYVAVTDGTNYGIWKYEDTVGKILVNKSGTVMKNRSKIKDDEDHYYVTDKNGYVTEYYENEDKWDEAHK